MGIRSFVRSEHTSRIIAAGPLLLWWRHYLNNEPSSRPSEGDETSAGGVHRSMIGALLHSADQGNLFSFPIHRTLMESASSSSSSSLQACHVTQKRTREPVAVYDFVIIGNGNVGQSALREIQRTSPSAKVAILDPLRKVTPSRHEIQYYEDRAIGLDPRQRSVYLEHSDPIRYKHAVLIATGSHGAPPPNYLCDRKSLGKIMELRPSVFQLSEHRERILPAEKIRQHMLNVVKQGGKVAIAGSGWDAIDLAVSASALAGRSNKPVLLFGCQGPLSHILPPYLTSDLSKRLKSKKIQIMDRTLIRYISHDDHHGRGIHLHTAKSSDFLDTQNNTIELLVIAPEVSGPRGSAFLPTDEAPASLEEHLEDDRPWYLPWSTLSKVSVDDPSMVHCYKDDGRIAVNSELYVCSGVYAAGSVAKVPNGITGHADLAGIGPLDGEEAGRVAAVNMLRASLSVRSFKTSKIAGPLTKDPIPIWRSDMPSYGGDHGPTRLSDVGVHALCVGNCDQERLHTHGIWWTNHSALRRLMRDFDGDDHDDEEKKSTTRQTRQRFKKGLKAIYGMGVVYYTNHSGRIQGIMTWGMPFCEFDSNKLNDKLVSHIKTILLTNGGFSSLESDSDHARMSEYLANQSKQLVQIAFERNVRSITAQAHMVDGSLTDLPRPLHRFSEPRPPGLRTVGILKRKGGDGNGVLGEDMFARYEEPVEDAPIPKPDYTKNVGFAAKEVENLYNWKVWEQKERRWDDNENSARPPKEDPLWIRKGDEMRSISSKDYVAAAYNAAMRARNSK